MKITNFRRVAKNTLRAIFDLHLPSGLIIRGAMLHENSGRRWIGLPARPYEGADGAQCWAAFIDFTDRDVRNRFMTAALAVAEEAFDANE